MELCYLRPVTAAHYQAQAAARRHYRDQKPDRFGESPIAHALFSAGRGIHGGALPHHAGFSALRSAFLPRDRLQLLRLRGDGYRTFTGLKQIPRNRMDFHAYPAHAGARDDVRHGFRPHWPNHPESRRDGHLAGRQYVAGDSGAVRVVRFQECQ